MEDILLTPGPVPLHPEVRRILSLPMIHHRTPEFDAILARTLQNLKPIFGTKEHVFIHTATGTGGMESLLVNTLTAGDEVLAVVSGKFGERWAQMAERFGGKVTVMTVKWGEAASPALINAHLEAFPKTRLVITQACETSTAVLHPIREIAGVVKQYPDCLLLVDGITAVGAMELKMDDWGIDGIVAGSQKAFMLPTGLSFVALSKKAWRVCENTKTQRFYFDLREEKKANDKGETFFSSAVPLIRALDWVLQDIQKQGLDHFYSRLQRRAEMTRHFALLSGLHLFSKHPSPSVTALTMPAGVDSQKIRTELEKNDHVTVMGGQDQAKGKILRVGHMGFISDDDMLYFFDRLTNALKLPSTNSEMKKWLQAHP